MKYKAVSKRNCLSSFDSLLPESHKPSGVTAEFTGVFNAVVIGIVLWALLMAFVVVSFCSAEVVEPDMRWNDPSGESHAVYWSIGTFITTGWLHLFTQKMPDGKSFITRKRAILYGAGFMLSLGLVKELSDYNKTGFSMNDLYHDVAGIAIGSAPFVLTYRF
jgi:hypothetical protein